MFVPQSVYDDSSIMLKWKPKEDKKFLVYFAYKFVYNFNRSNSNQEKLTDEDICTIVMIRYNMLRNGMLYNEDDRCMASNEVIVLSDEEFYSNKCVKADYDQACRAMKSLVVKWDLLTHNAMILALACLKREGHYITQHLVSKLETCFEGAEPL